MASLAVYDQKTGQFIELTGRVFLVNPDFVDAETMRLLHEGTTDLPEIAHKGYRIDNYNMGNLFYGEPHNPN